MDVEKKNIMLMGGEWVAIQLEIQMIRDIIKVLSSFKFLKSISIRIMAAKEL